MTKNEALALARELVLAANRHDADGVSEARNGGEQEFGEDRLISCARTHGTERPLAILDRLFTEVREFCGMADQTDDITMTVTRFRGTA